MDRNFSNQSLVFFIDGSGVANSPQFYTSTLVHEAMHMITHTILMLLRLKMPIIPVMELLVGS